MHACIKIYNVCLPVAIDVWLVTLNVIANKLSFNKAIP